jgi:ectoine hydroxylase-related dioxygenase (phytanoyl-CoA dioxygenase family)
MNWLFSKSNLEAAAEFHHKFGFVGLSDLLEPTEFSELKSAVDSAIETGRLTIAEDEMPNNNDCVYADARIEAMARNPAVVRAVRRFIGRPIELQHSKFNAKPLQDTGSGKVKWHQDFAFYPHSNFDLVSCIIHLDDEQEDAGPLKCIPGSHTWGPLSHQRADSTFAYECTSHSPDELDAMPWTQLDLRAGTITFHHALTLHSSAAKRRSGHRRFVIFQYRAYDAVQLAGVVWKCHGMQVEDREVLPSVARFPDGTTVELRGLGGRLFDVGGRLLPNRPSGKHPAHGRASAS